MDLPDVRGDDDGADGAQAAADGSADGAVVPADIAMPAPGVAAGAVDRVVDHAFVHGLLGSLRSEAAMEHILSHVRQGADKSSMYSVTGSAIASRQSAQSLAAAEIDPAGLALPGLSFSEQYRGRKRDMGVGTVVVFCGGKAT